MKEILIIGAGFAGITAAICAAEEGNKVTLAASGYSERSQSVMAMGGINAALNTKGQNDSVEEHYEDTMRSGCYINNKAAVRRLTQDAPEVVKWLVGLGVNFSRDENNNVDLRYFGGQKKMRTAYASARTGKQLMSGLVSACRKYEVTGNVNRIVGWYFLSLVLTDNNECAGALLYHKETGEIKAFPADAVILATGGANRIFGKTTGSILNDGSTTGIAMMKGIECSNLEMIQFHPTTIQFQDKRLLITEAARGEGGRLYTMKENKKWYFMEEWYPKMGALMPRDVVSRSIYKVCNMMNFGIDGKNQVYLDVTELPEKKVKTVLDEVVQTCTRYLNLDPCKEPIPVYPAIHYFMGGIHTDENHKTNIKGVYAAGECSSQYHGANRLGGNSTLGSIHGGMIAAKTISEEECAISDKEKWCEIAYNEEVKEIQRWKEQKENKKTSSLKLLEKLSEIMNQAMGIYRDEQQLLKAMKMLDELKQQSDGLRKSEGYYEWKRISAMILLAKSMIMSALERKESRGAHQRIDYQETDDKNYMKSTIAKYDVIKGVGIEFREI